MYPIDGKTEINVAQLVSAHKSKDGEHWTLYLTDDKSYEVTKHQYAKIRMAHAGVPQTVPVPVAFNIQLQGTAVQQ